ncbi:MAG TPA: tetratricopeptide repeat protein [Candidatus Obscuribacterales bacterium]
MADVSPPRSAAERTAGKLVAKGFAELKKYRPDKAINCFVPILIACANKPLSDETNRLKTARYLTLIGEAISYDENDQAAAQCYSMAKMLDPDDPVINACLHEALLNLDRPRDAEGLRAKLEADAKVNQFAALALANRYARINDMEKCMSVLVKARSLPPQTQNMAIERMYGRALFKRGFQKEAAEHLRAAAKHTENPYDKLLLEGNAQMMEQKNAQALESILKAGQLLPDDPAWYTYVAVIYSLNGDKPGQVSLDELAKAAGCKRVMAKVFNQFANKLRGAGKLEECKRCIDYYQKLKPWSADPIFLMGKLLRKKGDMNAARQEYEKALKMSPTFAVCYLEIAGTYNGEGKQKEALEVLRRGIDKCPWQTSLHLKRGEYAAQLGLWQEAVEAGSQALKLLPEKLDNANVVVKNDAAVAHSAIGTALYKTNQVDKAIKEAVAFNKLKFVPDLPSYLELIKIRPGHLGFDDKSASTKERKMLEHVALADMLLETRQLADSINEYNKAIELNPDDVDLHSYLLNVLTEKGNWVEAAKEDFILSGKIVGRAARDLGKLGQGQKKATPKSADERGPLPPVPERR